MAQIKLAGQPDMPPANIDTAETAKFSRLEDAWWNPAGPLRSLHHINPLRVGYIEANSPISGCRVLDVGCGGGILSETIAALGADVTGIDASAESIGAAKAHAAASGAKVVYRRTTAEEYAKTHPGAFDVVTCMELLEHVPAPASVVSACAVLARPAGRVFFATLNRNLKSYLFAILGAERILRLLPAGTHRWRRFVKPDELEDWANAAGLSRASRIGLHYNPFTRRYFLGENISVNYMACYRRTEGPDVGGQPRR
jgi:2-polyprenyl-6-hydroxyphenyl methylase/3-demethylubiquinone-9 3-methyltransferase